MCLASVAWRHRFCHEYGIWSRIWTCEKEKRKEELTMLYISRWTQGDSDNERPKMVCWFVMRPVRCEKGAVVVDMPRIIQVELDDWIWATRCRKKMVRYFAWKLILFEDFKKIGHLRVCKYCGLWNKLKVCWFGFVEDIMLEDNDQWYPKILLFLMMICFQNAAFEIFYQRNRFCCLVVFASRTINTWWIVWINLK